MLWQWQIVHEDPDQGQRQYGRNGPEVADILQVQRRTVGSQQARSEETGEIPAQKQRCCQVDDGYAQIADAGIDAERKAFVFLGKEEADVGHGGREVGSGDADEGDEQDERIVGGCGILQGIAQTDNREQQQGGGNEGRVPAADDSRQIRIEESAGSTDESGHCRERKDLVIRKMEANRVELGCNRSPERPDYEGEDQCPGGGIKVLSGDFFAKFVPKGLVFRFPMCQNFFTAGIVSQYVQCVVVRHIMITHPFK